MTSTLDEQQTKSRSVDGSGRPFETGRVLTMTIGHWVHDTYQAFLAPLLPVFVEKLSLSTAQVGFLSACVQFPSILQPFIGHLADRLSLRYFVIVSPAITAIAMSLLGVMPSYGLMILLLLVSGVSSASLHAVGPVMTGRVSGPALGRGMGLWMVGGELGRTVGPLVAVTALGALTLKGMPWLMIGGLAASLLLYVRLRDIPVRTGGAGPEADRNWSRALRAMGVMLLPLGGIIFARAFLLSALTIYLPLFLHREGTSLWLAGASLSILEGAGVVGAFLGGSLSDRFGRRRVLATCLILTPLLTLVFLAAQGWIRFPLLLLMGGPAFAVTPAIMAMVQESFPENRALANGIYMASSFGLRAVAILLLGVAGDHLGLRTGFLLSALVLLAATPLVAFLPKSPASQG